jgi:hypothetical protein
MIPPADLFMLFNIYYQTHYEEMRSAVRALYCENPLFELAINPYSVHKTQEDADKFKKQHADEVITEVFTAQTGKWNFFDCFKEQRESVNYYNKDTIILEEMTKQMERDAKLGQELMAKRIVKEKKKNIIEDGPDAETFNKWKQENAELSKLNAKYVGDMVNDDVVEIERRRPTAESRAWHGRHAQGASNFKRKRPRRIFDRGPRGFCAESADHGSGHGQTQRCGRGRHAAGEGELGRAIRT